MLRNFLRCEILNPRQLINVRCSREQISMRNLGSQERCDSICPPPIECPPKKLCLMDLYEIPCGSWKEQYDAKNAIYNRQLIVAIGVFIITLFAVNRVGIVKGYRDITFF